jgi:hypothetical protein
LTGDGAANGLSPFFISTKGLQVMSHTFQKPSFAGDTYDVGMWLINREGHHQFITLLAVDNIRDAIRLVNVLNGGAYSEHFINLIQEERGNNANQTDAALRRGV